MTDPTMTTAADYETYVRPLIAELEDEVDHLREALRAILLVPNEALGDARAIAHAALAGRGRSDTR